MTTATETTETKPIRLERETCSRCGGTGHYSRCEMYGTRCFRCAGAGATYTKRGQAAVEYLIALRSRRADSLKVGDRVKYDSVTGGGAQFVVAAIEPTITEGSSLDRGVMAPYRIETLTIALDGGKSAGVDMYGVPRDQMIEVILSKPERIEQLKQAIAYQDTLTKAGEPRKTRKAN